MNDNLKILANCFATCKNLNMDLHSLPQISDEPGISMKVSLKLADLSDKIIHWDNQTFYINSAWIYTCGDRHSSQDDDDTGQRVSVTNPYQSRGSHLQFRLSCGAICLYNHAETSVWISLCAKYFLLIHLVWERYRPHFVFAEWSNLEYCN